MNSHLEFKGSRNPAAFFTVPKLKNIVFEQLLEPSSGLDLDKLSLPMKKAFQNTYRPQLVEALAQAVLDDDVPQVKKILNFEPEILLISPNEVDVIEIESKKTWQRFLTQKPLIMAQKFQRSEVIEAILPYYMKLEQSDLTLQCCMEEPVEEANQEIQNKKLQAGYTEKYLIPLVHVIANNYQVNWKWSEETKSHTSTIVDEDEKVAKALINFKALLLPEEAVAIEEYFNIEQFLIAAYKTYINLFDTFKTWEQRDIFAVCVIGFLQSLISGVFAKAYCLGIENADNKEAPISDHCALLQLKDGKNFYRASRHSDFDLGSVFLCGIDGRYRRSMLCINSMKRTVAALENLTTAERKKFVRLTLQVQEVAQNSVRACCVIS